MKKVKRKFINDVLFHLMYYPCFSEDVKLFIACQFALESAFGTSRIAKECFNFCGMRFPLVRITTARAKDSKSDYALYLSMSECVHDYILCLQFHRPMRSQINNLNSFKSFIKWYCPEKDYINKITNILNSYQNGKENE